MKQLEEADRLRLKQQRMLQLVRRRVAKMLEQGNSTRGWRWRADIEPVVVFKKTCEKRPWSAAEDSFILSRSCLQLPQNMTSSGQGLNASGHAGEDGEMPDWEGVAREARQRVGFKFDWFLKGRAPSELSSRFRSLVRFIEREEAEDDANCRNKSSSPVLDSCRSEPTLADEALRSLPEDTASVQQEDECGESARMRIIGKQTESKEGEKGEGHAAEMMGLNRTGQGKRKQQKL